MRRAGVIVVVVLVRAVTALAVPHAPFLDTERYRNVADPFMAFRFDLGQGPGQLLQLLLLLPGPWGLVLQSALAGLLWAYAALVAGRGRHPGWFWGALAVGLLPWWLLWDPMPLTEALSLAGMVLFGVGTARWLRGDVVATPLAIGGTVALLTRPALAPLVVGALVVAVGARLARRRERGRGGRARDELLRGLVWTPRVLGVVILFALLQAMVWNAAPANFGYMPREASLAALQAADRFGPRRDVPGYLDLARAEGMPECPAALTPESGSPVVLLAVPCPEFQAWLDQGGVPWTAEWTHLFGATMDQAVSGRWRWATGRPYDPLLWHPAFDHLGWLAVHLALLWLVRPGRDWLARVLLACGGVAFGLVLWSVDGIEQWRHVLPALAFLVGLALASIAESALLDRVGRTAWAQLRRLAAAGHRVWPTRQPSR